MSARSEAKARGDLKYIPETPCKNGHVSPRYVKSAQCQECLNEAKRVARSEGRYKASAENAAKWRASNKKRLRLKQYGLTEEALSLIHI